MGGTREENSGVADGRIDFTLGLSRLDSSHDFQWLVRSRPRTLLAQFVVEAWGAGRATKLRSVALIRLALPSRSPSTGGRDEADPFLPGRIMFELIEDAWTRRKR